MHPGVALIAQSGRALPTRPPAMADASFLSDPGFIFEPQRDALVRMCLSRGVYRVNKAPFLNASCAAGSERGWRCRAFCRENPMRRTTRDRLAGCRRLLNRSSITRHSSESVQADNPSVSGSGPRRMIADSSCNSVASSLPGRGGGRRLCRARHALGVVAHDRIAQCLALHPRKTRRHRPAHAVKRIGNRIHPSRRRTVPLAAC